MTCGAAIEPSRRWLLGRPAARAEPGEQRQGAIEPVTRSIIMSEPAAAPARAAVHELQLEPAIKLSQSQETSPDRKLAP